DPLRALRLLEVAAELLLEDAVDALDLLLLAQLDAVSLDLRAAVPVLAGCVLTPLDRALVLEAAISLEVELHPLSAAEPADRFRVPCQVVLLRLRPSCGAG